MSFRQMLRKMRKSQDIAVGLQEILEHFERLDDVVEGELRCLYHHYQSILRDAVELLPTPTNGDK